MLSRTRNSMLAFALLSGLIVALLPLSRKVSAGDDDGCWIEIYDLDHFTGPKLRLKGPISIRATSALEGGWKDRIDSILVGPKARVEVWEDEDYNDSRMEFGHDSRIYDLSNDMNNNIDSLKIYVE